MDPAHTRSWSSGTPGRPELVGVARDHPAPVNVDLVVDQAGPLVVAQRVHADPGAAGGLGDAQACLREGAGGRGFRCDLEHALNRSVAAMSRCPRRTAGEGWLLGLAVRVRECSVAI